MAEESKRSVSKRKEDEDTDDIAKQYKNYINSPKFNLNSEEVYCICRRPDHGGELMINCDGCDEWFHFRCMKLDPSYSKLIARFYCKFCQWKGVGDTLWKRQCRLKGCLEPVRVEKSSKYCSDEHGTMYIKLLLIDTTSTSHQSDMKALLDDVSNVEQFHNLGTQFPELPEVRAYHENNENLSQLPESVQHELARSQQKLDKVAENINSCNNRLDFLAKLKEKHKAINSKVSETFNKGGKPKKYELCLFDKKVKAGIDTDSDDAQKLLRSTNIHSDFSSEIDAMVQQYRLREKEGHDAVWFQDHLCLEDKRRCPRHNGWFNLVQDEILRESNVAAGNKDKLENEILTVLRNYSMTIYENTN